MGLFDLVFPKKCVGCRKNGSYFCQDCAQIARPHFPQVCPVCERNSPDGLKHKYCKKSFTPEGLTSLWVYEGTPRKVILKLKYKFVANIAQDLARAAAQTLKEYRPQTKEFIFKEKDLVIVPIPLYWMRENWRGFNQSKELAKLIAQEISSEGGSASGGGWKVENLLVRTKRTKSQVGLKESVRKTNIEGVFELARDTRGTFDTRATLVLFDDVWTTGATMLEATKVLKKAGVRKVWCLTLAR